MEQSQNGQNIITRLILIRYFQAMVVLGLILFLPAWNLAFWNAWLYLAVLFIPMGIGLVYLVKKDPDLAKRRMKMKEKEPRQKTFVKVSTGIFLIAFIIPGLDFRYGWSDVPLWLVLLSCGVIWLGYLLFMLVMIENSYASRVIEVEDGQRLIDTGPYRYIRHPMYVGAITMYLASPLALGSYWALVAIIPLPFLIIYRILNEEEVLLKGLPGYKEYMEKVKYRLIPFIW